MAARRGVVAGIVLATMILLPVGVPHLSGPTGMSTAPKGATIRLSGELSDLIVDPYRPRAYTADRVNNQVFVLDLESARILATVPVRAEPTALAIRPPGDILYVGHGSNRSILAIDLQTFRIIATFETPFLTWDLVAPEARTLVATTHDPQWSGQYPYVLNSSNGGVIQRLCWSQLACNMFYQDTLVAASPDGSTLFLADSLMSPTALYSYTGRVFGNNTVWSYAGDNRGPGWGAGGGAHDLAISPDGYYLYLASEQGLAKIGTNDFVPVWNVRSYGNASAVTVLPSGTRVAMASRDPAIHLFDNLGRPAGNITMPSVVRRLAVTPDGDRFVAVTDTSTVEVVSSSPPAPSDVPSSAYVGTWLLFGTTIASGTVVLVLVFLVFRRRRLRPK